MPYYNYKCMDCMHAAEEIKGSALTEEEEAEVIFETRHAMVPEPAALAAATECPRCGSPDTVKVLSSFTTYTRGYGYLDRAGCHRDMNVHHLTTDDPYGHMREPGEAADLKIRLQRAGRQQRNPKHYPVTGMTEAVTAAVKS